MAQDASYQGLKSQILTSIFGRRLGIDSNDFLLGPKGHRVAVYTVTSATTGNTTLPNYGIILGRTTDSSATTAGWNLDNPQPGAKVELMCMTSGYSVFILNGTTQGAGSVTATVVAGAVTSGLTTATKITLWNPGAGATLYGASTSVWIAYLHGGSNSSATTYGSSAS